MPQKNHKISSTLQDTENVISGERESVRQEVWETGHSTERNMAENKGFNKTSDRHWWAFGWWMILEETLPGYSEQLLS